MPSVRRLTAILTADAAGNPHLIGTDEKETPVDKVPAACVLACGVVVLFVIASAVWLAWRLVSLELTAVYAEAFRKAGLPEE